MVKEPTKLSKEFMKFKSSLFLTILLTSSGKCKVLDIWSVLLLSYLGVLLALHCFPSEVVLLRR